MENCACMQELISRMLDGDLNAEEQAALAKHLEGCPECRRVYEAFRAVSASLGGELAEPPESLRENVMAEIRRDRIRRKNRGPWRAVLSAAAVIALALGLRFGFAGRLSGAPMSAAVKEFAAAPAEEESVAFDAAESEESAVYAAAGGETAARGALPPDAGEQQAAEAYLADVPAPAPMPAANSAASSRTMETVEQIDLSALRFTELLERLDGEPVEIALEQLPITRCVPVLCADNWLTLFEYEGDWYYYDPIDPTPRRSRLGPDEIRALAPG